MEQRVYSAAEAGQILGVGAETLILAIKRGEILSLPGGPGTKNRYRIPRHEIDRAEALIAKTEGA